MKGHMGSCAQYEAPPASLQHCCACLPESVSLTSGRDNALLAH